LRTEIGAERDVAGKFEFEAVRGLKRLRFLLLEYRFFRDSEGGSALPLRLPWLLSPLSLILHIVNSRAFALLRVPCYFVKLKTKIVGLMAIQELDQSLVVASLGVAKEYRRLGIGTCILAYIETTAKHLGKRWLEVDVLMKNIPARRLYTEYGFAFIRSGKMSFIMRGKKPL